MGRGFKPFQICLFFTFLDSLTSVFSVVIFYPLHFQSLDP